MKPIARLSTPFPVLCVHGFLGSPDDWDALAAALHPPFESHTWPLPGHGSPAVASFDEAVRALSKILAAFPRPPHLIGYSMGGRLAMAAALQPAARLASLTVISAQPGLRHARERAERLAADERLADRLDAIGLPRFVQAWYEQPLFDSLRARPALRRALVAKRAAGDAQALAGALRALSVGRQPSLWSALPQLAAPTLYIVGARDAKYLAILRHAAALTPRARCVVVPGAGHLPHLEHPAFVRHHIQSHLEQAEERIA